MRTTVAGIDFSTKEAWIVRRRGDDTPTVRRIKLPSMAAYAERDAYAAREFATELRRDQAFWDDVWLCGIEYPFTMTMGSVGMKTILGAFMASIPEHVHVLPLPARVWQPVFLREHPSLPLPKLPRKSADRKPLIAARAERLLATAGFTQDAYDAFGIMLAAAEINLEAEHGRPPGPGAKVVA